MTAADRSEISYAVTGLTCGHCVAAVTEELSALAGVEHIHISLVPGGTSTLTVTSASQLAVDDIAAALDEAGDYRLAS